MPSTSPALKGQVQALDHAKRAEGVGQAPDLDAAPDAPAPAPARAIASLRLPPAGRPSEPDEAPLREPRKSFACSLRAHYRDRF